MVIDPGSGYNKNAIGNTTTGGVRAKTSPAVAHQDTQEGAKADASSTGSDSVSLSSRAQSMARLETAVADSPEVDESRVAELKTAIEQGSYRIDTQAIAAKMLKLEGQF